jgi:hypothetical protein
MVQAARDQASPPPIIFLDNTKDRDMVNFNNGSFSYFISFVWRGRAIVISCSRGSARRYGAGYRRPNSTRPLKADPGCRQFLIGTDVSDVTAIMCASSEYMGRFPVFFDLASHHQASNEN